MRIGYYKDIAGLNAGKQKETLQAKECELLVEGGIASLLRSVGEGDVVVVATFGVFGATPASAVKAALEVKAKAAEVIILDQGIDTSKEEHRLFFQHAAAIMGVGAGKRKPAKGHTGGKPKVDPSALANAIGMYQSGDYKMEEIIKATGVSKSTLYRNLPRGDGDG